MKFGSVWFRYHALTHSLRLPTSISIDEEPAGGLKANYKDHLNCRGKSSSALSSRQPSETRSTAISLSRSRTTDVSSASEDGDAKLILNENGERVVNPLGGISDGEEEEEEKPKYRLSAEYTKNVAGVVNKNSLDLHSKVKHTDFFNSLILIDSNVCF